jgi:hypothetical protein
MLDFLPHKKEFDMTLSIDLEELAQFLVKAKIITYASGSDEFTVAPALADSHQLEYAEGNLLYRDIYYGGLHFIGMETVFRDEKPIWGMSYYGSVLSGSSEDQIAGMPSVLKAALREVLVEAPFRGPKSFQEGDYCYKNEIHGNPQSFYGVETISIQEQAIYRLRYSGGIIQ